MLIEQRIAVMGDASGFDVESKGLNVRRPGE
jgi:hypothetical protein